MGTPYIQRVTTDDVARLRLMVTEPTDIAPYTDTVLTQRISEVPIDDELYRNSADRTGQVPPEPAQSNDSWIPRWDMNRVAADIWLEKAGAKADCTDFEADGAKVSLDQQFKHCTRQSAMYRAKQAIKVFKPIITGAPLDTGLPTL